MQPKARQSDLVVEEFNNEVLVYDLKRKSAHSLNTWAAHVWRACDGTKSPAEISTWLSSQLGQQFSEDDVLEGLDRLEKAHLLEDAGFEPSRRQFMRKVGAAASLAVIASIAAPNAAFARSPGGFTPPGQDKPKGNNGVGNGEDPQPPGNPPINDGPGTGPGNPGNRGGANR